MPAPAKGWSIQGGLQADAPARPTASRVAADTRVVVYKSAEGVARSVGGAAA